MLRIEAVDGVRMPGAEREFYDRDKGAIVRAGSHTVEVRPWAAKVGPAITLRGGLTGELVLVLTFEPSTVSFTAEGGRDYEIQARRAPFDSSVRHVTVPQRPVHTQDWLISVVERPQCPECPN